MAGPTRAAGQPDYSSTGTSKFIPAIWSGKLVRKFYATTVFGEIANTDYQGDISAMGDSVIIRTRPNIAISDYEIGMNLQYQRPEKPSVSLDIDQAKYFAFEVKDIEAFQSDIQLMDEFTDDATEQMQIVIDGDILGYIPADVAAANAGATAGVKSGSFNLGVAGTPLVITKDNVLDVIVDMGTVLDEQNVPQTGRWLVLPPWACGMIKKSDLKDASLAGDGTSIMRNGRIGMIDRFTVYNSNNLSTVTDTDAGGQQVTNIVAGHKAGLTFASQMTEMEELPNPNDFGRLVRGLNVYGREVIEGNYLVHAYAGKG